MRAGSAPRLAAAPDAALEVDGFASGDAETLAEAAAPPHADSAPAAAREARPRNFRRVIGRVRVMIPDPGGVGPGSADPAPLGGPQAAARGVLPCVDVDLEAHVLRQIDRVQIGIEHPEFGHVALARTLVRPFCEIRRQAGEKARNILDHEPEVLKAGLTVHCGLLGIAIHLVLEAASRDALRQQGKADVSVANKTAGPVGSAARQAGADFAEAENLRQERRLFVILRGKAGGHVADARQTSGRARDAEVILGQAHGQPIRAGHAEFAVMKVATLGLDVGIGQELFKVPLDFVDVTDGDAKMAQTRPSAGAFDAGSLSEDADVQEAIGYRDVARVGMAELPHVEILGVEVRHGTWLLADNGHITEMRIHAADPFWLIANFSLSVH